MINFKQFLLEVNAEHNGTGGTQPPTVIYPGIAIGRDSPETMATGDEIERSYHSTNAQWQAWIVQQGRDMERMGATPEQIAKILRLLRQEYYIYQSSLNGGGLQGDLNQWQIYRKMAQFYNQLISNQSWYQSYMQEVRNRARVNSGINTINRLTAASPWTIPGIPNINSKP